MTQIERLPYQYQPVSDNVKYFKPSAKEMLFVYDTTFQHFMLFR